MDAAYVSCLLLFLLFLVVLTLIQVLVRVQSPRPRRMCYWGLRQSACRVPSLYAAYGVSFSMCAVSVRTGTVPLLVRQGTSQRAPRASLRGAPPGGGGQFKIWIPRLHWTGPGTMKSRSG